MTLKQAAATLSDMCRKALAGRKTAHITLFGIMYDARIAELNIKDILREASPRVTTGVCFFGDTRRHTFPDMSSRDYPWGQGRLEPHPGKILANLSAVIRWLRGR